MKIRAVACIVILKPLTGMLVLQQKDMKRPKKA